MSCGNSYSSIDLYETGKRIKKLMKQKGYSVKDIQNLLHLSCPQPIYRWMKGQVLPTVDHLYIMARVLHVHMEELLVSQDETMRWRVPEDEIPFWKRMYTYWKLWVRRVVKYK